MAAASFAAGGHHSLYDDDFNEYNPHPYQGGYDIALTYGSPLPPSAAICYPLSAPHPSPPSSSLPPPTAIDSRSDIPVDPQPEPDTSANPQPEPDTSAEPQSEPYTSADPQPELYTSADPPPEPYTSADPQPEPYISADPQPEPYASDPAGYWPPWTLTEPETHFSAYGDPEWRPWRRAATYLFGYSEGFGERWAGTDSYGIPIYANKTYGDRPLVVEVEPAREHKLEYYDPQGQQLDIVPYITSERWEGVEHNEYQEIPTKKNQYQQTRYDVVYGEQLDPLQSWCSSSYEERINTDHYYGAPQYGYNMHYGEESLHVQLEPSEVTMTQKPSYNGDYREFTASEVNRYTSSYGEPLEPFVPTWEQNPSYYGVYEQEAPPEPQWPFSSNSEQDYDSDAFGSHSYTYASHYHEPALSVQLEPFKPTWSQNPIYHEMYRDEPALSVQLEPFKPSWSQNPIYHEMYRDEISPELQQVDDPYGETTQFWPF